jgi:hypothetical protein
MQPNNRSKENQQITMSAQQSSPSPSSTRIITKMQGKIEGKLPKVAIGFPCYSMQSSEWWFPVMENLLSENRVTIEITTMIKSSSMLRDNNKNKAVEELLFDKRRPKDADINRNVVVDEFVKSSADYLFFVDDDTVFPKGALTHLISLGKQFVSGLYFLPSEPHNPIAYMKDEKGLYHPIWDYAKGTLRKVDSVGMGCAMIHRSVFDKIRDEHHVYQRPDGSIFLVHNSQITDTKPKQGHNHKTFISHGIMHTPVEPINMENDGRPYPYFALEYARTEDHYFCEIANNVGIKPWIDTTITCAHLKVHSKGEKDYRVEAKKKKETAQ